MSAISAVAPPTKVLHIVTSGGVGGAQSHVIDLVREHKSRLSLTVASGGGDHLESQVGALGTPYYRISHLQSPPSPYADLNALNEIRKVIRLVGPDVVHLHSTKAGLLGRLASRLERVPCVFTAHGWAFAGGVSMGRRAAALLAEASTVRLAARVITVSEYDRELALRYAVAHPNKVVTIRNGLGRRDTLSCRDRPSRDHARQVVSMVARFTAQKDHETALRAMNMVDGDSELWLIGDGPRRSHFVQMVKEMGLESRVRFIGEVGDVEQYLMQSDIFLLSSNWEGFPISIVEAMRAGLPVVATDVGGVAEAVFHGVTGLLSGRADASGLARNLNVVLGNRTLGWEMGREGRLRFEKLFGSHRMADRTLEVYLAAIGSE